MSQEIYWKKSLCIEVNDETEGTCWEITTKYKEMYALTLNPANREGVHLRHCNMELNVFKYNSTALAVKIIFKNYAEGYPRGTSSYPFAHK